jgi:3-phenylpropionate/trans-cinnamate dioxygenase ferredoxin reductase subunit
MRQPHVSAARSHIVIVGAGQAAVHVVESARAAGCTARFTLFGDEPWEPYQRPPLSKEYLAGTVDAGWLAYRPRDFYARNDVTVRLGERVTAIDPARYALETATGARVEYDSVALTTGARARVLPIHGAAHALTLRSRHDADTLRLRLREVRTVIVIGAGYIGLEVAAVLAGCEHHVIVLERAPRVLPRTTPATIAEFLRTEHRRRGVEVHTGIEVTALLGAAPRTFVECADGHRFGPALVIAGIGAEPNADLARTAGLACDDGILVDEFARSSAAAIVAAGDCTRHPNAILGRGVRLESVHNAVEQARTAGATLAGRCIPYRQVPWLWSDQYDLRIQSVGDCTVFDTEVVRGSLTDRRYTWFGYSDGILRGAVSINRAREFGSCRRLLNAGSSPTPTQAADPGFNLDRLLPRRTLPRY